MRVHDLAEEATRIVRANGFEAATWDNFPIKIMMVVTELDEAADAVTCVLSVPLSEELADAAIRLLGILHDLNPGWPSRIESRISFGTHFKPIECHLWPILSKCSKSVEAWRRDDRTDALIWTELALLEVYKLADRLDIRLDNEIVKKNTKNATRAHLHGKARSEG